MSEVDTGDTPDVVAVDLDNKDPDAFDIIVEDDTPEADLGKPRHLDHSIADQEDDLRGVADKTRKRIERLKFETNTERRMREAAESQRDAAVELARTARQEVEELRKRTANGSTALAASMMERNKEASANAQRRLADAHTDGDSSKIAEATAELARLSAEKLAIEARAPRRPEPGAPPQQGQPDPQQQQPARPTLPPNVTSWLSQNRTWFQQPGGEAKTNKAMSIHYDLVGSGVRPDSPEYTRQLDKRLKAVYPDHQSFGGDEDADDGRGARREPRRTNVVAEGSRESDTRRPARTVTLTSTEVALAKRLGVPLQKYAAEKQKREQNGKGAGA